MAFKGSIVKIGVAALLLAAATSLAVTPAAAAHKPYVLPFNFSPDRDYVGVEGGMVEDAYFVPDFAIRGSGDWVVIGPDGVANAAKQTSLKSIEVLDAPLPVEGTYRIGTGARPGRSGKAARIDGVWRSVRPAPAPGAPPRRAEPQAESATGPIEADKVPAGAEVIETQGFLIAETYVTRGTPNAGALKPSGKGFEVEPITHPNEIFVDEGFSFRTLVDGKPAANLAISVYRGDESYDEGRTTIEAKTDAEGKVTLKFPKPGVYMINTRYPGQTAPGAAPAPRNWGYSLTVEVTD